MSLHYLPMSPINQPVMWQCALMYLLYYFTLSNSRQFYSSSEKAGTQWVKAASHFVILLPLLPKNFTCQRQNVGI